MRRSRKTARHAGTAIGKSAEALRARSNRNENNQSRVKPLEQAADVLLVLQFPLTTAERAELRVLFERRLYRAYTRLSK